VPEVPVLLKAEPEVRAHTGHARQPQGCGRRPLVVVRDFDFVGCWLMLGIRFPELPGHELVEHAGHQGLIGDSLAKRSLLKRIEVL
jgi:hypothetical protein